MFEKRTADRTSLCRPLLVQPSLVHSLLLSLKAIEVLLQKHFLPGTVVKVFRGRPVLE